MLNMMAAPTVFVARAPWDVGGKIHDMVMEWLVSCVQWMYSGYFNIIGNLTRQEVFSASFDSIFGSTKLYELIKTLHSTAVVPIGESILALVMLAELVKISQRIDATSTLPAVKDIMFLFVKFACLHWFIINSLDVMGAIYALMNTIVNSSALGAGNVASLQGDTAIPEDMDYSKVTFGLVMNLGIAGLFSWLGALIAYILSICVVYARALQLYVMAAFAPIPISLIGFDETRQTGLNFLKNFVAVCLAGAIMVFILVAYPVMLASVVGSEASGFTLTTILATGGAAQLFDSLKVILISLGMTILLCMALVKAGAWAKEIVGS